MRYQSKRPRRQFLAGVTCPKCQKLDSVVQVRLFEPKPDEYIECTQCHHIERRPSADMLSEQLDSKYNKSTDGVVSTGTHGIVRFIK